MQRCLGLEVRLRLKGPNIDDIAIRRRQFYTASYQLKAAICDKGLRRRLTTQFSETKSDLLRGPLADRF